MAASVDSTRSMPGLREVGLPPAATCSHSLITLVVFARDMSSDVASCLNWTRLNAAAAALVLSKGIGHLFASTVWKRSEAVAWHEVQ